MNNKTLGLIAIAILAIAVLKNTSNATTSTATATSTSTSSFTPSYNDIVTDNQGNTLTGVPTVDAPVDASSEVVSYNGQQYVDYYTVNPSSGEITYY